MHVHVECPEGEAKFWLEPVISLASYHGLSRNKLLKLQNIVEGRKNDITKAWQKHFGR